MEGRYTRVAQMSSGMVRRSYLAITMLWTAEVQLWQEGGRPFLGMVIRSSPGTEALAEELYLYESIRKCRGESTRVCLQRRTFWRRLCDGIVNSYFLGRCNSFCQQHRRRWGGGTGAQLLTRFWTGKTSLIENSATDDGGGLDIHNVCNVRWNGTTFKNNKASRDGGAIHVCASSDVSWSGTTTFTYNVASGRRGGINVLSSSVVSWSGTTTLNANMASGTGGWINVVTNSVVC